MDEPRLAGPSFDLAELDVRVYLTNRAKRGTLAKTSRPAATGDGAMPVLCDTQIRELVSIEPFEENVKRAGKVSYGVSSYGYDVRVGTLFKVFTNVSPSGGTSVVDPKAFA